MKIRIANAETDTMLHMAPLYGAVRGVKSAVLATMAEETEPVRITLYDANSRLVAELLGPPAKEAAALVAAYYAREAK